MLSGVKPCMVSVIIIFVEADKVTGGRPKTGAIAGGLVAVLFIAMCLVALAVFLRRRKNNRWVYFLHRISSLPVINFGGYLGIFLMVVFLCE